MASKWHGDVTFDMASVFAVLRVMVIVGECTKYLSNETKERGVDMLPFNNIESVRNLLAHANRPPVLRQLRLFVSIGSKEKREPVVEDNKREEHVGEGKQEEEEREGGQEKGKEGRKEGKEIENEKDQGESGLEKNKGDEKPGSGRRRGSKKKKDKEKEQEEPPIECRGLLRGLVEVDLPELREKMASLAHRLQGPNRKISVITRRRHKDDVFNWTIGIILATVIAWSALGSVVACLVGGFLLGILWRRERGRAKLLDERKKEKWGFLQWEKMQENKKKKEKEQLKKLAGYLEEITIAEEMKDLFLRALKREATLGAEEKKELFRVLKDKERIKEWCKMMYPQTRDKKEPKKVKITKEERIEKMKVRIEHNKNNKEKKGLDHLRTLRKLLSVPMYETTKNVNLKESVRDALQMIDYIQDLYRYCSWLLSLLSLSTLSPLYSLSL